jgi:hypothetical protein
MRTLECVSLFPMSPRVIPDGGISPVRLGTAAILMTPSHAARRLKRWPAYSTTRRVCSTARHARLQQTAPATVWRLRRAACPPLPRAPLLRRRYPPSSLLQAHAQVLWPPRPSDLSLVSEGLCRSGHPRLVHRTVPALTSILCESVTPPTPRVRPCTWPFLPGRQRPSPQEYRLGIHWQSRNTASRGANFRRCRHSLTLQPSRLLALLAVPTGFPRSKDFVIRGFHGGRFRPPCRISYATEPANCRGGSFIRKNRRVTDCTLSPSTPNSACARWRRIATSASASSTGGRATARRPTSTSPPPRLCTAIWTCGSGWSRRRRR